MKILVLNCGSSSIKYKLFDMPSLSVNFRNAPGKPILGVPYEDQKIITAHVGNGGSITAIKNGKSVDTSMGLTPVEGLLMGTRCGDVDAGALSFIMDKEGMDGAGLSDLINKRSGVAGLSGISSDMREIEAAVAAGNPRAIMPMYSMFSQTARRVAHWFSPTPPVQTKISQPPIAAA